MWANSNLGPMDAAVLQAFRERDRPEPPPRSLQHDLPQAVHHVSRAPSHPFIGAAPQPALEIPADQNLPLHIDDVPQDQLFNTPSASSNPNSHFPSSHQVEFLELPASGVPLVNEQGEPDCANEPEPFSTFSLSLDLGETELSIRMDLPSHVSAALGEYIDGSEHKPEPRLVARGDVEAFTWQQFPTIVATGKLITSIENELDHAELADDLASEESFLIIELSNVVIALFPSRGDLENGAEPPEQSNIGFHVRVAEEVEADEDEDTASLWMSEPDTDDEDGIEITLASELVKSALGVEFEEFFKWPTAPHELKRNIFFLMDEDREAEIEALSRVFEWAGAQTRTLKDEGAWEDFKYQKEGVVIVGFPRRALSNIY